MSDTYREEELVDEALDMLGSGQSIEEVAISLNVSVSFLRGILHKSNDAISEGWGNHQDFGEFDDALSDAWDRYDF